MARSGTSALVAVVLAALLLFAHPAAAQIVRPFRIPAGMARLITQQVAGLTTPPETTSTATFDVIASVRTPPADAAQAAQQAIDLATLGLLSSIFNLVSGTVYSVSGGLATVAGTIGLGLEEWGFVTGRYGFLRNLQAFGETLVADGEARVLDSNLLGDAGKYVGIWNNLQQEIASGGIAGDIADQLQQMTTARAMIAAVTDSVTKSKKL